jgi:DNA-binding NtrC family response regulator
MLTLKEELMLGTRLLIIDDEEPFVAALGRRLEHRNITVLVAYSGEDGLKKLDENPDTDVVLLDVKMPGMNGIETLRRIRAAHPLVEVIMLTGHATVETAIEGMKLGAFDYLMKPADFEKLMQKVQQAIEKRKDHQLKIVEAFGKELRGRHAV